MRQKIFFILLGFFFFPFLFFSTNANAAISTSSTCFNEAKKAAKTLLDFYNKSPDMVTAVGEPSEKPSIKSPDAKRKYRVIEVPGFIYKGTYRIRLIYASIIDDACFLMGEEILDLSKRDGLR